MIRVLLLAWLAGCVTSDVVVFASGRTCPSSTTCDETHQLCVDGEQLSACAGLADVDACQFGDTVGECDGGVCIATFCGDGVVTGTEECDGDNLRDNTCLSIGYYFDGPLTCNSRCAFNVDACTGWCGDGQRYPVKEYCDGTDLPDNTDSCVTYGYDAGGLSCSSFCSPGLDGCAKLTWAQESSLSNNEMAMWGSSATDIFTVGGRPNAVIGRISHWDGFDWIEQIDIGEPVRGVWGTGPTDVYVVGGNAQGTSAIMMRYDGTTWSTVTLPSGTLPLRGVWVGGGSGLAVGATGTVLKLSGSTWSSITGPTVQSINAVWGSSPTEIFVGADDGVYRYDGVSWTPLSLPTASKIYSLYGFSATSFYAVGDLGKAFYFDGSWHQLTTPDCTHDLYDVWASSVNDVYVVGSGGNIAAPTSRTVYHYNGVSWAPIASPTDQRVVTIWGTASDDVWLGAFNGIHHGTGVFYGESLLGDASINPACNTVTGTCADDASLGALAGKNEGDVYAFGSDVCHYDGTNWEPVTTGGAFGGVVAAWVSPDGMAFGAGALLTGSDNCGIISRPHHEGRVVRETGSGFVVDTFPVHTRLWDISGISATDVIAVGYTAATSCDSSPKTPFLRRFNGSTWSPITPPNGVEELVQVWMRASDDFYVRAVGTTPGIHHFSAGTWTLLPEPADEACGRYTDLTGTATQLMYICYGDHRVFAWNGTSWTASAEHDVFHQGNGIAKLVAIADDDMFVLGDDSEDGKVVHYRGGTPSRVRISGSGIKDAWGTSQRLFWIDSSGVRSIVRTVPW